MTDAPVQPGDAFLAHLRTLKDDEYVVGQAGLRGVYLAADIRKGMADGAIVVRDGVFKMVPDAYDRWQSWMIRCDLASGPPRPETKARMEKALRRAMVQLSAPKKIEPEALEVEW